MDAGADIRDRDAKFYGIPAVALWGSEFDTLTIAKTSRATLRGVSAARVDFTDADYVDWEGGGGPPGSGVVVHLEGCPCGRITNLTGRVWIHRTGSDGKVKMAAVDKDYEWGDVHV